MSSKFVKFFGAGRWARANVAAPQYEVEADEVKELDAASAAIVVDAKRGEYVDPPEPEKDEEETEETSENEGAEETKNGKGKGRKNLLARRGRRRTSDPLG